MDEPMDGHEWNYNPRCSVPDHAAWMAGRAGRSAVVRTRYPYTSGWRYGPSTRETLDVFPASKPGAPAVLYLHGGYWRSGCAADNAAVAEPFLQAGAAVFLPDYPLCPAAGLADIVRAVRRALAWACQHTGAFGARGPLVVAGLSAGAHLAAMALADTWEPVGRLPPGTVRHACLVSGIYDLRPVLQVSVNRDIGLTPAQADELSPLRHRLAQGVSWQVWAGTAEPPGWQEQTDLLAAHARAQGAACSNGRVADAHHFSIFEAIAQPNGPIGAALLAQLAPGADLLRSAQP
jgi:arylformamidase